MIAALVAAALVAVILAGCVVVYAGDQRMLQPMCIAACDATAARVSDSASGSIHQTDDSQGHLSPRGEGRK